MKIQSWLLTLLLSPMICFAEVCESIKPIETDMYAAEIGTRKVTFLAVDLRNNKCWAVNQQRLNDRHGPYSTFKIPHTIIALETGAVKSIDERIEWNQTKYPAKEFWPETWKQSHTLATAFKHSAVWYYKALVPRIAPNYYKKWLAKFHYGNQTFTPGSDEFWLNSEIKISPVEQVSFIVCLLKNQCGVHATVFSAFEKIAMQESKGSFLLYGKTGTGPIDPNNFDGAFEGWYVGYVKDGDGNPLTAFAIFMEAESFSALQNYRKELSLKLLSGLGLWVK
ncbi:MAG: class D beta-lactamase [Chitinophagaceae bacterium]|nr:MAG: class D beta-lactamase [Chitinophagaceae bacterium]